MKVQIAKQSELRGAARPTFPVFSPTFQQTKVKVFTQQRSTCIQSYRLDLSGNSQRFRSVFGNDMSSFTVKMAAGPLPPVRCGNRAKTQEPAAATVKRATILPQVRGHELRKLQTPKNTSTNVSRRDLALFLTAASLSGTTLSSPEPAEARISRGDIKKKILEQLKMLREKAGLSKPETEEKDKIAPPPPPPPPSGAENAIPLIPLPLLPGGDHKTVVDATLP